jgi:hypothetical protein
MAAFSQSEIIRKLQLLISHQQSAAAIGNQAEAEAFAGRIQQMLSKHKLSMTDLEAKEEEKEGVTSGLAVDPRRFGMKDKDGMIPWLLDLARSIAKVNDCEILVQQVQKATKSRKAMLAGKFFKTQTTNQFIFVGIEVDRVAAEEFYVYMAKLVWEYAGKAGDDVKERLRREIMYEIGKCAPGHLSAKLHDFRHSYCKGFVSAVTKRMIDAREAEKAQAANTETGLMVIDRRAVMVRTYVTKISTKGPATEMYNKGRQSMGFEMGRQQGQKVALTSKTVSK